MNRFIPLLLGLTASSFLGVAQAQSFNPAPSAIASKVFEAALPKEAALEPTSSKAASSSSKARAVSKAPLGFISDGRPRFNPSASQGARALLAPPSAFKGPQSFNPSISPEARVLLAPVSKADERRARLAANQRDREAKALAGPGAKDVAQKGEGPPESDKPVNKAVSKTAPKDPSAAQLDLIRSRLIEAAQRSNINVRSLAWVDSDGKLYEASRFDSDARVRGVRVNSYLGDSSVELGAVEARPKDCSADDLRFARHAYLEVLTDAGGSFFSSSQLALLAQYLEPDFRKLLTTNTGWRLSNLPTGFNGHSGRSLYEQRLLGRSSENANYRLSLRLLDMGNFRSPSSRQSPTPADRPDWVESVLVQTGVREAPEAVGVLGLTLTITEIATGRTVSTSAAQIAMRLERAGYLEPVQPVVVDPQASQQALQALQTEVRRAMGCKTPEYPVLQKVGSKGFLLNAGQQDGLLVGMQVLLSSDAGFMSKILQPGIADTLILGVVESVTNDRAVIQQIAGPAVSSPERLVGMPI
jgi:hypothetical protein